MSETTCTNEDCTFDQTGICVLDHDPKLCPYRGDRLGSDRGDDGVSERDERVAEPLSESVGFPASYVLSLDDVRELMRTECCHLIGLLGEPDSGKTACIVSLYLLLSRGVLDGFSFADSKSLMALEELSRGARTWPGSIPDEMTIHTERADDRSPGFLHIKVRSHHSSTGFHLLIPDLPGEWSTSLREKNRTDRFGFLRAADEVWVMIDGRKLIDLEDRNSTIHRAHMLVKRLVAFLAPEVPSLRFVISRDDQGRPDDPVEGRLRSLGDRCGLDISINHIASFSDVPEMRPGSGISGLINSAIDVPIVCESFWPTVPSHRCSRDEIRGT